MNKTLYTIVQAPAYLIWFSRESLRSQLQIKHRLSLIETDGHFGDHKCVNSADGIWELKWKNGPRVYFGHLKDETIAVLVGGNKNGQDKDIKKAQSLIRKWQFY